MTKLVKKKGGIFSTVISFFYYENIIISHNKTPGTRVYKDSEQTFGIVVPYPSVHLILSGQTPALGCEQV